MGCASWRPPRWSTSSRPRTATSRRPCASPRTWSWCGWRCARSRPRAARARPRSKSASTRTSRRLDEELKLFRQTLGDDVVDWLDSRWSALLKAVYSKQEDPDVRRRRGGRDLPLRRGPEVRHEYPITEKSLAGRVKQAQPIVDHLARKREQDKRKITLVAALALPARAASRCRRENQRPRRSAPGPRRCWIWPPTLRRRRRASRAGDHDRGARGGAAAGRAAGGAAAAQRSRRSSWRQILGAGLQWMHDAGVLGGGAARAGRDRRLLAGGRAPAQGRLGAHQAGGAAVGARARSCAGRRCCTTSARCRRG